MHRTINQGPNIQTRSFGSMPNSTYYNLRSMGNKLILCCDDEEQEIPRIEYGSYAGNPGTEPPSGTGGAISKSCVNSGEACQMFKITSTAVGDRIMIGFTRNLQSATNWTRLDWAVYFYNGTIRIYGRNNGSTGSGSYYGTAGTYAVGDIIEICVDSSGNLYLNKNGATIYTWTNQVAGYPIYPAFYAFVGSGISDVGLKGTDLCD